MTITRRTTSFIIYKPLPNGLALLCHARPGSTRKEAWDNARDTCRTSRKEFRDAGWMVGRLHVEIFYCDS